MNATTKAATLQNVNTPETIADYLHNGRITSIEYRYGDDEGEDSIWLTSHNLAGACGQVRYERQCHPERHAGTTGCFVIYIEYDNGDTDRIITDVTDDYDSSATRI